MPRVVPSQVVDLIDRLIPEAKQATAFLLRGHNSDQLTAVLDMIGQIPSELIVLDGARYAEFISSCAAIRGAIQRWHSPERASRMENLAVVKRLGHLNPITMIRQALSDCPDESPTPGTAELSFISDTALRDGLRRDISAVNSALTNGEWKAATVLAGSVIEALLLWSLQQCPPTKVASATTSLVTATTLKRKPTANLEAWSLSELIEVATHLKVIKEDTAVQTRLAKDYRNLIHPGRTQRLGQICDRGTALAAVAALEHVVTDISS